MNDVAPGKERFEEWADDSGRVRRPDAVGPCPCCGTRRAACGGSEASVCGPGRDGLRRPRRSGHAVGMGFGRGRRGRRLGPELGRALRGRPGRARGAVRPAGNGDRLRGPPLLLTLPTAAPGARGAPGVRGRAILLLRASLYGLDGRVGDGAGPDPPVLLLGSYDDSVVLPHRV